MQKNLWFRIQFSTGFETFSQGTGKTLGECKTDAILRCWETRPELPTVVAITLEDFDQE